MKILSVFVLLFVLSSCGFESKSDFKADQGELKTEDKQEFPEIKYVKAASESDSVDFKKLYGKGKTGDRVYLKDAIGNLTTANFAGKEIGISLKPSSATYNTYPAVLSYENEGMLTENEFGPVAAGNNIFSQVDFDIVSSESGPMLLVSQIVINEKQNTSAYYLYNRYLSLVDSYQFINSVDNVNVSVYRLGDLIDGDNFNQAGDLQEAIDKRVRSEQDHLKDILDLYKVKYSKVKATIENKEIEVGHLTEPGDGRIIDIKCYDRDDNGAILAIKEK